MSAHKGPAQGSLVYRAWAKINLTLEISGRRPDGYHELDSLVVFAALGDGIRVTASDDLALVYSGPFASSLPAPEDNLVLRAARACADLLRRPAQAKIELTKALPVASGIGGGSADAAATLDALLRLWGETLSPERLAVLALSLGADLPVCLFGRPALMSGIGDQLRRAPSLPAAWLLLANPGQAVSTAEVFGARRGDFTTPKPWPSAFDDLDEFVQCLAERSNDLEAPARALLPDIDAVLTALLASEGCLLARMSGSGATCFGLFAEKEGAATAAASLAWQHPTWWLEPAALLHGKLQKHWDD